MILNAGHVVAGRYEIIEKIGSGGMAIVYRAKDMKLDRFVTIKILREEHISNDEFRQRFRVEARAIACLNHPNIVNVYDVGNENTINYIVMEYIDGVTLKELITKRAPFGDEEVIGVSIQVALALSHAHKNGVIHRDIKPQNILVTPNGTIKVTDFGIARSANSNTVPVGGSTMGSVHYISPEQAKGEGIDARSDLYSIGILMYEMVTGTLPYDSDNSVSIALMHINEPLPYIRQKNPDISLSIEGIIDHLTDKNPARRYQSADNLVSDLKIALTDPDMMSYDTHSDGSDYVSGSEIEDEFDIDEIDSDLYDNGDILEIDKSLEKKVYLAGILTAVIIIIIISLIVLPMIKRPAAGAKVEIPDLIGMDFDEASQILADIGLEINKAGEENDEIIDPNVITWQGYSVGDKVEEGTTIDVKISLGTNKLEIPDLTKKELSTIVEQKYPFKIIEKGFENSDTIARGVVISQSPEPGEMHEAGTEIHLIISSGPKAKKVTVPDVVGMSEADAKTKLQNMGLAIGQISSTPSAKYSEGLVATQNPSGGKEAFEGTIVVLAVSSGPPAPTTPPPSDENPDDPLIPKTYDLKCNPYIEDGVASVILTVNKKDSDGIETIYTQRHDVADFPVYVPVTGVGVVEYHMLINGIDMGHMTFDFSRAEEEDDE